MCCVCLKVVLPCRLILYLLCTIHMCLINISVVKRMHDPWQPWPCYVVVIVVVQPWITILSSGVYSVCVTVCSGWYRIPITVEVSELYKIFFLPFSKPTLFPFKGLSRFRTKLLLVRILWWLSLLWLSPSFVWVLGGYLPQGRVIYFKGIWRSIVLH